MSKWTTKKQRDTLIRRNPVHIEIESYVQKDRVPKEVFYSWTEEEQEFYYIFTGLYNHGYYPYECNLIPPRMVKEMREEAQRRKKTDIYENGLRDDGVVLEDSTLDEFLAENTLRADVINVTEGDTLARHGGIEFAIATIATYLIHLDGTVNTETHTNITNFIRIITRIVNEEKKYRGTSSIWRGISQIKKKKLGLTLSSSEIDRVSLKEAKRMLKLDSFTDCISRERADIIRRLQVIKPKTRFYMLKNKGMMIAALIRINDNKRRYRKYEKAKRH